MTGFLELSISEQALVEAIAETIIPSDSNGPGAKEAGAIYFIDRQLAGDYGRSGGMYMQGPFVPAGLNHPITVAGYNLQCGDATTTIRLGDGLPVLGKSEDVLEVRSCGPRSLLRTRAYGGNFETLCRPPTRPQRSRTSSTTSRRPSTR